jgi:hypothetical protein
MKKLERFDICDDACKHCSTNYTSNKTCTGCKVKPLCKEYNDSYKDIDKCNEVVNKINSYFDQSVKPVKVEKEITNILKEPEVKESLLSQVKEVKSKPVRTPVKKVVKKKTTTKKEIEKTAKAISYYPRRTQCDCSCRRYAFG